MEWKSMLFKVVSRKEFGATFALDDAFDAVHEFELGGDYGAVLQLSLGEEPIGKRTGSRL